MDYFVSNTEPNRSDSNAGTDPKRPWATVGKAISALSTIATTQNDRILFKRGEIWRAGIVSVSASKSGHYAVLGSYGTGEKPIFDGSRQVLSWTVHSGKIYKATLNGLNGNPDFPSAASMTGVFLNDQFAQKGRFPKAGSENGGFLTNDVNYFSSATYDPKRITDYELGAWMTANGFTPDSNANTGLVGAECASKTKGYFIDVVAVTSISAPDLYTNNRTYGLEAGLGYFFQNKPFFCTQHGEWAWDKTNKILYMYLDTPPANHKIEIAFTDTLLDFNGSKNVIIENLKFQKSRTLNLRFASNTNCFLWNCDFFLAATNALTGSGNNYNQLKGNNFTDQQNNAVNFTGNHNEFLENTFNRTALHPGMGSSKQGNYSGLKISGINYVKHNHILKTGYNALSFGTSPVCVIENFIDEYNTILCDGGGIYTFDTNASKGAYIIGNIVKNGIGNTEGAHHFDTGVVHAIYSDGGSSHCVYKYNSLINGDGGLFNHLGWNERMNSNKISGMKYYPMRISWDQQGDNGASVENDMSFNKVAIFDDMQKYPVYWWAQNTYDPLNFGTAHDNKFINPLSSMNGANPVLYYSYQVESGKTIRNRRGLSQLAGWTLGQNDQLSGKYFDRYYNVTEVGSEIVTDGSFSSGVFTKPNDSAASFQVSRITSGSGVISGGTMQVKFVSPAATDVGVAHQRNKTITAGKYYRCTFQVKAAANTSFVFKVRSGTDESNGINCYQPVDVGTSLKTVTVIWKCIQSSTDGRIIFDFRPPYTPAEVWIDNVSMKEVTVQERNYFDAVFHLDNPSKVNKVVDLPAGYTDEDGNAVTQVVIKPYDSVILLKDPAL